MISVGYSSDWLRGARRKGSPRRPAVALSICLSRELVAITKPMIIRIAHIGLELHFVMLTLGRFVGVEHPNHGYLL